jgi:hypothetical protein
MPAQRHGRSASAPTPPPYQSILLPNVYPSCPTSPSLLPMITQRASQTRQPDDCGNNFDFLPHDNFMPSPSFGQMNFEASLQVCNHLLCGEIVHSLSFPSHPNSSETFSPCLI